MKTRWKIASSAMVVFTLLLVVWQFIPMTSEMRYRPHYYFWSHGLCPISQSSYLAFQRDITFQNDLIGEPVDSIRSLFPEWNDGSRYRSDSYRSVYRPTLDRAEEPVDCYWLRGSEDNFGFCVLTRDGIIVSFRYVKG